MEVHSRELWTPECRIGAIEVPPGGEADRFGGAQLFDIQLQETAGLREREQNGQSVCKLLQQNRASMTLEWRAEDEGLRLCARSESRAQTAKALPRPAKCAPGSKD